MVGSQSSTAQRLLWCLILTIYDVVLLADSINFCRPKVLNGAIWFQRYPTLLTIFLMIVVNIYSMLGLNDYSSTSKKKISEWWFHLPPAAVKRLLIWCYYLISHIFPTKSKCIQWWYYSATTTCLQCQRLLLILVPEICNDVGLIWTPYQMKIVFSYLYNIIFFLKFNQ